MFLFFFDKRLIDNPVADGCILLPAISVWYAYSDIGGFLDACFRNIFYLFG